MKVDLDGFDIKQTQNMSSMNIHIDPTPGVGVVKMKDEHYQSNADHFETRIKMTKEGGFMILTFIDGECHKYIRRGDRVISSMEGWYDIKKVTPKGWAKKHVVVHP